MDKHYFDEKGHRPEGVTFLKNAILPDCYRENGMCGYSGAEFEFRSCPAFMKGVSDAALGGMFGFTLPGDSYRSSVCWWMENVRSFHIEPEWIVTTHGTIYSLATLIRLVTSPQDSIIVMTPGYNRYEQAAVRLGRKCRHMPLKKSECRYTIDFNVMEQLFREKDSKIFVLTNPNNPTGTIFPAEDLERIAGLSKKYGVYVFSDEIFAEIAFRGKRTPSYAEISAGKEFAVTCTSAGKVFSLTGVNHANVIIPDEALRQKYTEQRNSDHYGSLDPMVHAGIVASFNREGSDFARCLCDYVWDNFTLVNDFMAANLPAAKVTQPDGTYVCWIDYSGIGMTRDELEKLLTAGLFIGDCGEEYYGSQFEMRYSLACPRSEIEKSLNQLKKCLEEI